MIRGLGFNTGKILLFFFFLSGVTVSTDAQGTSIGGVINQYMDVVAVGADNVTLSNADIFQAGDTVLLIQMKGVVMNGFEDNSNGSWAYNLGTPGGYEFLIIQSVNINTENIIFTRNLVKNYNVAGLVQLIKVPSYSSASVTTELTCQPWDSVTAKAGGVLAMIVEGTLSLNAGINVNGKGFIGGTPFLGQGICINDNTALYDMLSYPESYTNSGFKGEGLVSRAYLGASEPSVYPGFAKGKGFNLTGGGGGNGRFAGGGGGAGIGSGGRGGRENGLCAPNQGDGGKGGLQVLNTVLEGNILLGGGGGSSTYATGGIATPGGRGGGIIIIVCDTLIGNGKTISAEGTTPAVSSSNNAGSGGGGAGGTIALCQKSFSSLLATSAMLISANGGNGGNAINSYGEGGGGGGGLILTNNVTFPANVTRSSAGGAAGTRTGGGSGMALPGLQGENLTTFIPLLNGFLFNTIRSARSNNRLDSVCSNMLPPRITGTNPVGGTAPYNYTWQDSTNSATQWMDIPGYVNSSFAEYQPPVLSVTTSFRRIVRDASATTITDVSRSVKIIVHQGISNNIVGNRDTICYNDNPASIDQLMPDLIVPSTKYLFYAWQDSSSSGTWGPTIGTGKNYDPPALVNTTRYRRTVTSGSCVDTSPSVEIKVLPLITGNQILSSPEDICFGMKFQELRGSKTTGTNPSLGGGDDTYRFKWESNINYSGGWITAQGISDRDSLDPVEQLLERIPQNDYEYRRIVYSGNNDVCSDTSNIIHLRDFPVITSNYIFTLAANEPICYGSAPQMVSGNPPNNGNGLFTWQDSTNSSAGWQNISGFVNTTESDYHPPVLTATTSYRRIALSTACSDTSNSIEIIVLPPVSDNFISLAAGGAVDTTICDGQTPHGLIGTAASGGNGIFSYQWQYGLVSSGPFTDIPGATMVNYPNPPSLTTTTFYKRQVKSGTCTSVSSVTITINVLAPISNNIITAGQPAVCENYVPDPVTGSPLAGGTGTYLYYWEQSVDAGVNWTPAEGVNTLSNYQPPALAVPMKYRRTVSSGPCQSQPSAAVDISINPLPVGPVNAGMDESIYSLYKNHNLNADPPVMVGETGFWTALGPGTATIGNEADSKTEVRNLSTGTNLFVWSITNGLCTIKDSVYIELLPDLIPQGFSPNGDAWNNTFIIEGLNLSDNQIAELSVLNGAGTVVFTTTNRNGQEWIDWDGRNNKGNELPEGTYYYLLKLTTTGNQVIKKSGFIELKRY